MSTLCWGNTAARLATSTWRDIRGAFPEEIHLTWVWGGGFWGGVDLPGQANPGTKVSKTSLGVHLKEVH